MPDILYDILKPLGMPIVDAYFKIKEDTFLNTASDESKGAEAIGNWFLTPSRILFGGRKVTKIDPISSQCEMKPEVSTAKPGAKDFLVVATSILSLLPSVIIGSAFKGLAYAFSENTRLNHKCIKESKTNVQLIDQEIQKNHELFASKGIETKSTGEFINPEPAPKPNPTDPKTPKEIAATLKIQEKDITGLGEICKVLDDASILWWADFGTCLGVYRHHDMIPWDKDIDISILAPDHEIVHKLLLAKLPKDKFDVWDFSPSSNPGTLLKIRNKETGLLIDIYHYKINESENGENTIQYEFSHKNAWYIPQEAKKREIPYTHTVSEVFPLKEAKFGSIRVKVPNKLESYLVECYSQPTDSLGKKKSFEDRVEELKPCRVWSEEKKEFVKVPDHPYFKQSKYNY